MHAFLPAEHPFLKKHGAKIQGVLSCFDRVIFRGYLPICHPKGLAGWMWDQGVAPGEFKHFAPRIAERLLQHAKDMAARTGRPYQYHASRQPKEEIARAMAERDRIEEGLVCVFSCLETCRTFRLKFAPGRPRLEMDLRRCTVLYYFFMDKECGLIHVKLHTWLPLTCQVYVNGHSWLECQLRKHGLKYRTADNAFVELEDAEQAQRLADRFARVDWRRRLDGWAAMVNPLLGEELQGPKGAFEYWWVVDQAEYSSDLLFGTRAALAPLHEALVQHASLCFGSQDVLRFFGRKLSPSLKIPVQTEKKPHVREESSAAAPGQEKRRRDRRGEWERARVDGTRVRHQLGTNKLKMYDKQGMVLRIETVINDPRQFRVRRRLGAPGRPRQGEQQRSIRHLIQEGQGAAGKGPLAWLPMRKGVAWLWKYAEVSFASNRRYLEALAVVDDPHQARHLLDRASRPQRFGQRRRRALQPLSPQDQALFLAVLRGEHHLQALRNRDLAQALYGQMPKDKKERRRIGARVTRLIQLLRAHGLLAKVPRARRYRVTCNGLALMSAAIYVRYKHLPRELIDVA